MRPDYVINGGGIINVASEYYGGESDAEVLESVVEIGTRLTKIFEDAEASGYPTNVIADNLAQKIIAMWRPERLAANIRFSLAGSVACPDRTINNEVRQFAVTYDALGIDQDRGWPNGVLAEILAVVLGHAVRM